MDNKETNIVRKSASISLLVIVGKVLGFVKQAVIAWAFGSNSLTDVFFAADGYASMFGQIMSQTVGPTVLTQYIPLNESGQKSEAKRLIRDSYLFFSLLSIAVISINFLFADEICNVIGLSYTSNQLSELKYFLIAMLPVMLFTSIIGVSTGFLDSHNKFLPGRLTSLFFSICIIGMVFAYKNQLGLRSLLYGFILGYVLHMLFTVVLVIPKVGFGIENPFRNPEFVLMIKRFLPLVIGISVIDLGHLVDRIIASSLESGSVSALYYGQVISSDIVSAIIVTSVGSVLLTSISKDVSSDFNSSLLKKRIQSIMSTMTYIIIGITSLYFVESSDLIRLFFERGNFVESNTAIVSTIAMCYSIGFVFSANRDILVKTHYAFHDTTSPMINSIAGVVMNVILSIMLSKILGTAGIALSTSISLLFVFLLSTITLKKHIQGYIIERVYVTNLVKSIICCVIAIGAGKGAYYIMNDVHYLFRMISIGIGMCIIYLVLGYLIKEPTAIRIREVVKNKSFHT